MALTFWADPNSDPKRNFKFILLMGGIPQWLIKKTSKPNMTIGETAHKYINHSFYFPGSATWDPITVELVDPIFPDASKTLQEIIRKSGYNFPTDPNQVTTISKAAAVAALGRVAIQQINAEGGTVEEWELVNAWIKSVKYGELSYDSDDLTTISLELRYDYAVINLGVGGPSIEAASE